MRRRPRGERLLSARRADRPRCVRRQSASSSSSRRWGIRGCHSLGSGRITAPGSSWPQSTRIVQRKRRPTSNVDSMMVLGARRGGTGSKYVTFRGGRRRAIPFLLVGSGACVKILALCGMKRSYRHGYCAREGGFPLQQRRKGIERARCSGRWRARPIKPWGCRYSCAKAVRKSSQTRPIAMFIVYNRREYLFYAAKNLP